MNLFSTNLSLILLIGSAMPSSTSSSSSSQRSLQPGAVAAAASSSSSSSSSAMRRPDPHSVINLRLILVSGKTKDFQFHPSESAGDIAQYVFDNWPSDWSDESVSSAEILRLIYQGRFLHGNVTLAALGLPTGKTTVMHLVPRESLPEPNSQDDEKKKKSRSSRCCACCGVQ